MAIGRGTQTTKHGKCLKCGADIQWLKVPSTAYWILVTKDTGSSHVCEKGGK